MTKKLTPLMDAASFGDAKKVETILLRGEEDPREEDDEGYSALMHAAWRGHEECVRLLLPHSSLGVGHQGLSALMVAAGFGHVECLNLLVSESNLETENFLGETPLIMAASGGFTECVKVLLRNGARGEKRSRKGHTALMRSALNGHSECVKILLPVSDVHLTDSDNSTALDLARKNGNKETALLIEGWMTALVEKKEFDTLSDLGGRAVARRKI